MANDTLIGNGLANGLTGNQGDDALQGGLGHDTYWFAANAPLGTDERLAMQVDETGSTSPKPRLPAFR